MAHNPLKLVFIPTWWLPRSWSRCLTTDAGESLPCPVLVSGFWKQCYECLLYFLNSLSNRDNYYLQFGIFPFRIPGRIQREASSHSLNLVPFGAWGYPGPPGALSLCFLSSRERASASHPFSDFCRRFFFLLLAIPPVFGLSPFPHHFFPYSFLKKHFYTSHWNSLFYNEPAFFTLLISSQKSVSLSIIPQWSWEEKKSMPCSHHLS